MAIAVELCERFEGIDDGDRTTANLDPYLDLAGVWTVGRGHAIVGPDGKLLRGEKNRALARALYPGGITLAEADVLLRDDMRPRAVRVATLVTAPINDAQFNALVDFEFNTGALAVSRVLRCVNARDYAAVPTAFMLWAKADGRRVAGLVRRRACEAAVFAGDHAVAEVLVEQEAAPIRRVVAPLLARDLAWLRTMIAAAAARAA